MAYIGDSSGDVPGLSIVGLPFGPANAADSVKNVPGVTITKEKSTKGVLEAYHAIIKANLEG